MINKHGYKTTEIGVIPEEWEVVTLEDKRVSKKLQAGGTPLRSIKEYYEKGEFPFVRIEDMTKNEHYLYGTEIKITEKGLENSSAWLVPPNTILFSMYASYGEAVINRIPVATNQAIIAIIPQENVEIEYLYYSLKQLKSKLYRHLRETTQKNLNAEIVRNLKIPLPPFLEQRKIAAILCRVDEAIQKTAEIIQKTQELKKGLMQQLLTKGIGHTKFKQTEIGEIPEEWEVTTYGKVTKRITYGFTNPMPHVEKGHYIITAKNIMDGQIDYSSANITSKEAFSQLLTDKSRPSVGDVLITKDGTIGRVAIVNREKICINQSVAVLIPLQDRISSSFLYWSLQSPVTQKLIEYESAQTTIGHISITKLGKMKFPLPPLTEQKEIAERLFLVNSKLANERVYQKNLLQLKKGLMQDLLTGRVRVKVD